MSRAAPLLRRLSALALVLSLGGCLGLSFGGDDAPTPSAIVGTPPSGPDEPAAVIGEGTVTVGMLLPLTAGGSASGLADAFRNAAQLAMDEVTDDAIRIVVRDTAGEAATAKAAAEAVVGEGAQVVLGPVFAPAVSGAAEAARAGRVPLIGFSTDASLAGRGVYLLSFLPRQDASRIISFAAENDITAFAALVPDNGYGVVMEAAFREAVASARGRVVAVERYQPGEIAQAANTLRARGGFGAVFVPNGGDDPAAAAQALGSVKLLGSGQWDNSVVRGASGLVGAWYPGPERGGFEGFSARYQRTFGTAPPRTASLVYDAVLLANGLVASRGAQAFQRGSVETAEGFLGVDGIFRLSPQGLSERGLAVYEVRPNGAAAIAAEAPDRFAQSF